LLIKSNHGLMSSLALAAALLAAGASPAQADVLVDATGSNNGFPFNITDFGLPSMRYQQVYDASALAGLSGQAITGLRFAVADFSGSFAGTLSNVSISLSTTAAGSNSLSATYANNVGADSTLMFSGALSLAGSGPGVFDIFIPFAQSFSYDPTEGNLLLDVSNFGGGKTTQFRFGANTDMGRIYGHGGAFAASGTVQADYGLATEFVTTPAIPEPETYALVAMGLGVVAFLGQRRRRQDA
jgi:hypothetical protein